MTKKKKEKLTLLVKNGNVKYAKDPLTWPVSDLGKGTPGPDASTVTISVVMFIILIVILAAAVNQWGDSDEV